MRKIVVPAAMAAAVFTASASALANGRAPDAPEDLEGFAFLIGCFRLETSMRDETTGEWTPVGAGAWRGRWAMNGWAIYDEWEDIPFPGWAEHLGRGANTRIYDPEGKRFVIAWSHTELGETRDRRARRFGDRIVVWQPSPPFDGFGWQAEFQIGENGEWVRIDKTTPPEKEDWTGVRKIEAVPVACSDEAW